jgi:hypothetical protein
MRFQSIFLLPYIAGGKLFVGKAGTMIFALYRAPCPLQKTNSDAATK